MATLLEYEITTVPDLLEASLQDAALMLVATNPGPGAATILGIKMTIPVGPPDATTLTDSPHTIQPSPEKGWSAPATYANGSVTFAFTPPNNIISVAAQTSLSFIVGKIQVNDAMGIVPIMITEGSLNEPEYGQNICKFPGGWGQVNFWYGQDTPDTEVTLNWSGPLGAIYTIQYLDPATQTSVTIPAPGNGPLSNAGKHKVSISATTVFTMNVSASFNGWQYPFVTQIQRTVTVAQIPVVNTFTGFFSEKDNLLQLNLNWTTSDAELVIASWSGSTQAPNKPDKKNPVTVSPPFKDNYNIVAESSNGTLSAPLTISIRWEQLLKIGVGRYPQGIVPSPDGNYAYVLNDADSTISVMDLHALKVITNFPVTASPVLINATPDGQSVLVVNWVQNPGSGSLSLININTHVTGASIPFDLDVPRALATDPHGQFILLATVSGYGSYVMVINPVSLSIKTKIEIQPMPLTIIPNAIIISNDGNHAWLLSTDQFTSSTIIEIDLNAYIVTRKVQIDGQPAAGALTIDGKHLLVVDSAGNAVSVFDVTSLTVINKIVVGAQPTAIATSPDGQFAFVANYEDNTVSKIDLGTFSVMTTAGVGTGPIAIVVTADSNFVFAANLSDCTVSQLGFGVK